LRHAVTSCERPEPTAKTSCAPKCRPTSSKTETSEPPSPATKVAAPEPAAPAEPAAPTYTVVSGDTLWAISERFYRDDIKYQVIEDASVAANPDLIHPSQVVTMP
jgi:nucleoid-associated protein YgaU